MTHQQEILFACDRCHAKLTVPLQNTPVAQRVTAPEHWTTLWLNDITRAPRHLCQDCSLQFRQLMAGCSS